EEVLPTVTDPKVRALGETLRVPVPDPVPVAPVFALPAPVVPHPASKMQASIAAAAVAPNRLDVPMHFLRSEPRDSSVQEVRAFPTHTYVTRQSRKGGHVRISGHDLSLSSILNKSARVFAGAQLLRKFMRLYCQTFA